MHDADVVIIGSGVGGGAVASQLAGSSARVLMLERGGWLPREPHNGQPEAVFVQNRYTANEYWFDGSRSFRPNLFPFVGGQTKFFGAAMLRLRERDFACIEHEEGISPAWPIHYHELEPWYAEAERRFGVRGQAGEDPTEPSRSGPYPFAAVPDEPVMAAMRERFRRQGLRPFSLPLAVDFGAGGACRRCANCDAVACDIGAKGDAEVRLVRPALAHSNVQLHTHSQAVRLITDTTGRRVVAVEVQELSPADAAAPHATQGKLRRYHGDVFVLSTGAIASSALLLRSGNDRHPRGLANGSDLVGRHYMTHNTSALMALHPLQRNPTRFPKTVAVHDFYFGDGTWDKPLGSLQPLGKIREPMLRGALPMLPHAARQWLATHSVDWYAQSEDLPHPDSRVTVRPDGGIDVHRVRSNMRAHRRFLARCQQVLRACGYPVVLSKGFDTDVISHQCGTTCFGLDASTSVLDPWCKAWELDNLYVVDSGFFPSSAAVNPALTVAAQALRVGQHLRQNVLRA